MSIFIKQKTCTRFVPNNTSMKLNLIYDRKNKAKSNDKALVQLRVYHDGVNRFFSTGVYLEKRFWDTKRQQVKDTYHASFHANKKLTNLLQKAESYFYEQQAENKAVTAQDIIDFLCGKNDKRLIKYIEQKFSEKALSDSTEINHARMIAFLKDFDETLLIRGFTFQKLIEFEQFLSRQKSQRDGKALSTNYVALLLETLRQYIIQAENEDLLEKNPFKLYTVKKVKPEKRAFTFDELAKLERLDVSKEPTRIQESYTRLLFMIYTGQRISDNKALRRKNFIEKKGMLWLVYKPIKTTKTSGIISEIPLSVFFGGKPEKLIQPLLSGKLPETLVFESISNHTFKKDVLRLLELAGIGTAGFTTNTTRHTCKNLLEGKGMNIRSIMTALGHKNAQTTHGYGGYDEDIYLEDAKKAF